MNIFVLIFVYAFLSCMDLNGRQIGLRNMNKLHNFKFIGEFPLFETPDDSGSFINDAAIELNVLSQDMYLPPFDNTKAYYDFSSISPGDFTTYNLRFLEGYDTTSTGTLLDEIDIDSISTELIFLENFEKDFESAVFSDITLQDIFMDQQIMSAKESGREKACFSDNIHGEAENNVINLYYMSEKPPKENRKVKASSTFEREKYYTKKRRTL